MTETFHPPFAYRMTIAEQYKAFRSDPRNADLRLTDMRRSGALEMSIGSSVSSENPFQPPAHFPIELERLEGPIARREIPVHRGKTGFHYFLDGTQKTLPVDRAGLVPVIAAFAAAGILERNTRGESSLLAGSLREKKTWIFPQLTGSAELARWEEAILHWGEVIEDPLLLSSGEPCPYYPELSGHYGRLIELSQRMSGKLRGELETDLLHSWSTEVSPFFPDRWMVVDGRLQQDIPRALGLVKSLQTQHLGGNEAIELFELPQGYRTTAFRYVARHAEHDQGDHAPADQESDAPTHNRTMWYQRFWDASGLDARHGLVRIEAPHDVNSTEEIDLLASWLMSERLPRPTMDPRWPTLLYPIHFLEEILKRRIAAMTAGWPS